MTKWSYLTLDAGPGSPGHHALDQAKLNELGLDGWEMVCIVPVGEHVSYGAFKVYLKRPIP